jgi:hypothetical protein
MVLTGTAVCSFLKISRFSSQLVQYPWQRFRIRNVTKGNLYIPLAKILSVAEKISKTTE